MKKILVVDDESDLRDMLRFALETEGFEVLEAADIQKAYWLITLATKPSSTGLTHPY